MNAHEIEQIEKDIKANFRLPLAFEEWADVERRAREERARILGAGMRRFFASLKAKTAAIGRQLRSTAAADCGNAKLHHG